MNAAEPRAPRPSAAGGLDRRTLLGLSLAACLLPPARAQERWAAGPDGTPMSLEQALAA